VSYVHFVRQHYLRILFLRKYLLDPAVHHVIDELFLAAICKLKESE